MKTVIFLFKKDVYQDGLDKTSKFNIFKWTYDMCDNEYELDYDDGNVLKLNLSNEEDLAALEEDFNDGFLNTSTYIIRTFNVDNNK